MDSTGTLIISSYAALYHTSVSYLCSFTVYLVVGVGNVLIYQLICVFVAFVLVMVARGYITYCTDTPTNATINFTWKQNELRN